VDGWPGAWCDGRDREIERGRPMESLGAGLRRRMVHPRLPWAAVALCPAAHGVQSRRGGMRGPAMCLLLLEVAEKHVVYRAQVVPHLGAGEGLVPPAAGWGRGWGWGEEHAECGAVGVVLCHLGVWDAACGHPPEGRSGGFRLGALVSAGSGGAYHC
jgi:hypothetical protein